MNERKFKVWCKNRNEWEKDKCLLSEDGVLLHEMNNGRYMPLRKDNHVICWETRRSDINGNTVFDGHIIRECPDYGANIVNNIALVFKDKKDGSWSILEIQTNEEYYLHEYCDGKFEIIGHKFTHPELLKVE